MGKNVEKGRGFIAEFKKFITRGNVLDMAVGVIVGGAFTSIVTSLNQDILTPILGLFGGTDFGFLSVALGKGENAPVLCYGNFITAVMIKGINAVGDRMKKLEEKNAKEQTPAKPTTKKCPFCLSDIPLEAVRCPHCTSHLDEEEKTEDCVEAE